jgi:uncharacterized protein YodC (DUF2158 family)
MSEQKFADGAVVRLKSGGPKMTVIDYGVYGYGGSESYKCTWFDDKNKRITETFTEAELELVPTSGGPVKLERG